MFPRVKEVVQVYNEGGLKGVEEYFNQEGMQVDPSTWCGHIKKSIDDGYQISVDLEISSISEKFNFYKDVSEKTSRTVTGTVDGEGDKEYKR